MSNTHQQTGKGVGIGLAGGFFGLLLTASVIATAAGLFRGERLPPPQMESAAWLSFAQGADGLLEVREAGSNEPLRTFDSVEDSFARGVYKSVVREREMRGIGSDEPLKLGRTPDGQLMLFDPATSTRIALRAFGETNAAVFEKLLERVLEGTWETTND